MQLNYHKLEQHSLLTVLKNVWKIFLAAKEGMQSWSLKKKIIRKSSNSPMISVTRSAATLLDAAQTNLKYRSQTRESRAWASALKSTDQRTTDWCHIHSVAVTQVIFVCFLTLQSFCTELYTLMDWQHRAHDTPGSELTHLNTLQYSPYRGHHLIFLSIKAKKWIVGS